MKKNWTRKKAKLIRMANEKLIIVDVSPKMKDLAHLKKIHMIDYGACNGMRTAWPLQWQ